MAPRGLTLCLVVCSLRAVASSSPSCHISSRNTSASVTCSHFSSPSDFEHFIQRPLSHPTLRFLLKDSRLEALPSGAFVDVSATSLELSNVSIASFAIAESNPFAGLEASLEAITFSDGSSLPETWAIFKDLHRLSNVSLTNLSLVNLTRDFGLLPTSVTHVLVRASPIGYVDEDWLGALPNLQEVSVEDSHLTVFLRSMLPKPAAALTTLELRGNNLTLLPKDFGDDLPALRQLDLSHNQITTLEEESLRHLQITVTRVSLFGNPLHCDCQLRFLLTFPDIWRHAECASPPELRDRNASLSDVTEADLQCAQST
ncbi:unnamed protein product [Ixodes hexagonus]